MDRVSESGVPTTGTGGVGDLEMQEVQRIHVTSRQDLLGGESSVDGPRSLEAAASAVRGASARALVDGGTTSGTGVTETAFVDAERDRGDSAGTVRYRRGQVSPRERLEVDLEAARARRASEDHGVQPRTRCKACVSGTLRGIGTLLGMIPYINGISSSIWMSLIRQSLEVARQEFREAVEGTAGALPEKHQEIFNRARFDLNLIVLTSTAGFIAAEVIFSPSVFRSLVGYPGGEAPGEATAPDCEANPSDERCPVDCATQPTHPGCVTPAPGGGNETTPTDPCATDPFAAGCPCSINPLEAGCPIRCDLTPLRAECMAGGGNGSAPADPCATDPFAGGCPCSMNPMDASCPIRCDLTPLRPECMAGGANSTPPAVDPCATDPFAAGCPCATDPSAAGCPPPAAGGGRRRLLQVAVVGATQGSYMFAAHPYAFTTMIINGLAGMLWSGVEGQIFVATHGTREFSRTRMPIGYRVAFYISKVSLYSIPVGGIVHHIREKRIRRELIKDRSNDPDAHHREPLNGEAKIKLIRDQTRDNTLLFIGLLFQTIVLFMYAAPEGPSPVYLIGGALAAYAVSVLSGNSKNAREIKRIQDRGDAPAPLDMPDRVA